MSGTVMPDDERERLHAFIMQLADHLAICSEVLSKRAERRSAVEVGRGERCGGDGGHGGNECGGVSVRADLRSWE